MGHPHCLPPNLGLRGDDHNLEMKIIAKKLSPFFWHRIWQAILTMTASLHSPFPENYEFNSLATSHGKTEFRSADWTGSISKCQPGNVIALDFSKSFLLVDLGRLCDDSFRSGTWHPYGFYSMIDLRSGPMEWLNQLNFDQGTWLFTLVICRTHTIASQLWNSAVSHHWSRRVDPM
jgi:hypothetical protein